MHFLHQQFFGYIRSFSLTNGASMYLCVLQYKLHSRHKPAPPLIDIHNTESHVLCSDSGDNELLAHKICSVLFERCVHSYHRISSMSFHSCGLSFSRKKEEK